MGHNRRRAFTFIEVTAVLVLLAIFFVLAFSLARSARQRPQSRSAGQVLAAFLRCQRERARSCSLPVAVVWSSLNGTTALSNACEALLGWDQPVRVDRLDLQQEFTGTTMFLGHWPSQTLSFTQLRPQWGSQDDKWDPSLYLSDRAKDPALIFLPSGKVTARNCWRLADNYVLLVGQQIEAQDQLLQAAGPCVTLRISPNGWVDLQQQVLAAQIPAAQGSSQMIAGLVPAVRHSQGPALKKVLIQPDPGLLKLPGGVDALVAADGFLTLTVEATSPSGQSLYMHWKDEGGKKGAFSSLERQPLEWDLTKNCWSGVIHWRPPASALNGERFRLECHVTDEDGREAPQGLSSQVDLQVSNQKARMAFVGVNAAADGSHQVFVINEDGTGKRELPLQLVVSGNEPAKASWSPDGTRLAYFNLLNGQTRLWTCNADGSGTRCLDQNLPGTASTLDGVHWSPDGTWLAHIRKLPSQRNQVFVVHPDGSQAQQLNTGSGNDNFVRHIAGSGVNSNVVSRDNSVFSADGHYLATIVNGFRIHCYPVPGSNVAPVELPGTIDNSWSVVWNPLHPWLAFSSGAGLKIYDVKNLCYFQVPAADDAYAAGPGCFSPDGYRYVYGRGNNLFKADLNANEHKVKVTPLLLDGQMMGWLDEQRFTLWGQQPSDMYLHDLQSNSQQNLTNEGQDLMFCGWSQ